MPTSRVTPQQPPANLPIGKQKDNLAICLSGIGLFSSLCDHKALTADERARVREVERRENLTSCLTGAYPLLCKHDLLTPGEAERVKAAEVRENLKVCLTGRLAKFCRHELLTPSEAARVKLAERVAERRPSGLRPTNKKKCVSGHWIEAVMSDGEILKLEDGSLWEVDAVDVIETSLWLPMSDVVVCSGKIINTDDNEAVAAERIN